MFIAHPEYIYWATLGLLVWPCSLFSRCAFIVLATWMCGQVAYAFNAPEPHVQVALYMLAMAVTWKRAQSSCCRVVAGLYFPLAAFSAATDLAPTAAWWCIFTVAMLQAVLVPMSVDRQQVRQLVSVLRERRRWDGMLPRWRLLWAR